MKASDFRIGNLIYYHIEDSMDERKEWDEISPIDYDDLRCFETYEDDSEYRPIPLTEEWLLKFGFKERDDERYRDIRIINKLYLAVNIKDNDVILGNEVTWTKPIKIKYVHQLQNLYYALCNEELVIK